MNLEFLLKYFTSIVLILSGLMQFYIETLKGIYPGLDKKINNWPHTEAE